MRTDRIVVAGASLGGLRTAEQLRRNGFTGELVVVGDEPHMPYNRPPLSKEVLAGKASFDSVTFRPKAAVADVVWRLGGAIVSADLATRVVRLADGEELPYAGLVVATGLRPRRLDVPGPGPGPAQGRHVIRTIDDALALRHALRPGVQLVVVGAGFVGCEVAATARGLGAEVTVVEPEPLPLRRPLGELPARALLERHRAQGVRFALGRTVTRFTGHAGRVTGVELDDGTRVPADAVVEAVGALPNTGWLAGNGLDLSDGVLCDGQLRAVGASGVVAVGDVARFPNPRYDTVARRVEHWSVPGDSAKHAARVLLGQETADPFAPLPSFWSDQYTYRIQSFGAPALGVGDVRVLHGDPDADGAGDLVTGYHDADGRLVGVVALGGPAAVAGAAAYRSALNSSPLSLGALS
ncbi:NAD(P)/FAD-dependent oxidoreductase [Streptomyces sp. NPDC051561]|uniref:NAD(P)/FAD-dependent oxidoreductase n=1 Tax=Streptomyces sp. NPDC051561 TaxID=3365658 RepID=UPI00378D0F20